MRTLLLIFPMIAVAGCTPPAPQTAAPAVAATFDAPMDPGLIRCAQLTNPAALAAATDWTMGQARAAALSGRIGAVPDEASVAASLSSYCGANGGATIRTAAAQIGV